MWEPSFLPKGYEIAYQGVKVLVGVCDKPIVTLFYSFHTEGLVVLAGPSSFFFEVSYAAK